jgi:glycosyltransferase involved in cell wall biosynthesis
MFVFPSWHEGFGLPVLEAMACGAAVIGAGTSSIPEVIGRQDALFDPRNIDAITAKMTEVLGNPALRAELAEHGTLRSREFSWDHCARVALDAMRAMHLRRPLKRSAGSESRPRLAYVSPLPPERSGIADYSAELLPALAQHYQIEVVTDQGEIADPWINEHLQVRSVEWFAANADSYDRVLYHFGNSPFHGHMFKLLELVPGTVVLHDFYLSGIASHLEWASKIPGFWTRALYGSHGYRALIERDETEDQGCILEKYPCNAEVLEHADGIVVHSRFSAELADHWYGAGTSRDWSVIPLLRAIPPPVDTREAARESLGLAPGELLVCCFGILGPSKLNHVVLDAWLTLPSAPARKARLVFVGASHDPVYDTALKAKISRHGGKQAVSITGYVDLRTYRSYLAAADIGIQLRSSSRGETSAAVLDCMASAIPTIVNAHGSMNELPSNVVLQIPDGVTLPVLREALASLLDDAVLRRGLGDRALAYCMEHLDPAHIAEHYRDAIELNHRHSPRQRLRRMAVELAARHDGDSNAQDMERLAIGVASNQTRRTKTRQLLVDISELVRRDAKSGIQRVVRSILMQLLMEPPAGYRVEPVYSEPGNRYRYARHFTARFLGLGSLSLADDVVDAEAGDILLGIDLALEEVPANIKQYRTMRDKGVAVYFVVYDLLPLILADHFPPHAYGLFSRWLETLATVGNGALCISRSVADELLDHLDAFRPKRSDAFRIGYFHLGADIDSSIPTIGISAQEASDLSILSGMRVLLMVGTIEPRKGHAQVLDAFDELCSRNSEVALALVGKPGWMTNSLADRIRSHPQAGKRLFWFEGASDELLARLYAVAQALLVPSKGEGFGLPLIEAAQHGLPIICRDLPVFREIAGDGATYFSGSSGADLAEVIERWMALRPQEIPSSANIPRITWRQSKDQLVELLMGDRWLASWDSRRGYSFPAYDQSVLVEAGSRETGGIHTQGRAGMLLACKASCVRAGSYRFRIFGEAGPGLGDATLELLCNGKILVEEKMCAGALDSSSLADVAVDIPHDDSDFQARLWVGVNSHFQVSRCTMDPLLPP